MSDLSPLQMHEQNLERFSKIESRIGRIEDQVALGVTIAKYVGGAGVTILSIILVHILMSP
jgi:hypothetical protein